MSDSLPDKFRDRSVALVEELGLGSAAEVGDIRPLEGGVDSDILVLQVRDEWICVKFALAKLRVAEDWQAPVHRNAAEYAWLEFAASVAPDSAVRVYGRSLSLSGFAMEFLAGPDVFLWKRALLAGERPAGAAEAAGHLLGRVHAASAAPEFNVEPFANRDDFYALRIEPYISFTAGRHPSVAKELMAIGEMLYGTEHVLVHGDVSPKNIMFRDQAPVFLDAECATMGDACFDPAFCLNHLLLKAVHLPKSRAFLFGCVSEFWAGYASHIDWEDRSGLEARVCRLIPALMLARVDGKSPVEYLSSEEQVFVRQKSLKLIGAPPLSLQELAEELSASLRSASRG